METTAYLRFAGIDLTVRGYHIPDERPSATSPGQAEQFEVIEVYVEDCPNDLSELIGEDRCKDIAKAIIKREGVQ